MDLSGTKKENGAIFKINSRILYIIKNGAKQNFKIYGDYEEGGS